MTKNHLKYFQNWGLEVFLTKICCFSNKSQLKKTSKLSAKADSWCLPILIPVSVNILLLDKSRILYTIKKKDKDKDKDTIFIKNYKDKER